MNTQIWGPLVWNLLNDVAVLGDFLYQKSIADTTLLHDFFLSWRDMLPCKYCRESFTRFSSEMPPQYPYRKWIYHIHNKVNQKLEKPIPITLEVWLKRCQVYRCFGNTPNLWDLCFILVLNYNPQKEDTYKRWFHLLQRIYPLLVRYRRYDSSMMTWIQSSLPSDFSHPRVLLYWLVYSYCKQKGKCVQEYKRIIKRIQHAIASRTPEEIQRICGPFLFQ